MVRSSIHPLLRSSCAFRFQIRTFPCSKRQLAFASHREACFHISTGKKERSWPTESFAQPRAGAAVPGDVALWEHAPEEEQGKGPGQLAVLSQGCCGRAAHPTRSSSGTTHQGRAGQGRGASRAEWNKSKPGGRGTVSVRTETSTRWERLTVGYTLLLPGHQRVFPKVTYFPRTFTGG